MARRPFTTCSPRGRAWPVRVGHSPGVTACDGTGTIALLEHDESVPCEGRLKDLTGSSDVVDHDAAAEPAHVVSDGVCTVAAQLQRALQSALRPQAGVAG